MVKAAWSNVLREVTGTSDLVGTCSILDYYRSPARRPRPARAEHTIQNRAVIPYHIREQQLACWHSTTDTGRPSGLPHRV